MPVLQASLPVTTYYCAEDGLAAISSSLRRPEQIQKDSSQSKLIIKSADLTKSGYPGTLTSSRPSDSVIRTSGGSQDKQQKSREADHDWEAMTE